MAIIYSYPPNNNILSTDIIVCTSTALVGGKPKNQTKSLSIGNLTAFITTSPSNNLNQVLTNGNTSELDAKIGALYLYDGPNVDYAKISVQDDLFSVIKATSGTSMFFVDNGYSFTMNNGTANATIINPLTVSRTYTLPDKSGTIALTSDIPSLQQVINVGNTIVVPTTVAKGIDITLANQTTVFQNGISVTIPTQTGTFPTYSPAPDAFVANINGQTPGTLIGSVVGFLASAANDDNIGFFADLTATSGTSRGFEVSSFDAHTGDYFVARKYTLGVDSTVFKVANNGDTTAKSFIKTGGTASQFLKADGSVDSSTYAVDSTVVHNTGNETINGGKTFVESAVINQVLIGKGGGTGLYNYVVGGNSTLQSNTTGTGNIAFGINALTSNLIGNSNTAIGINALYDNNASNNIAIGNNAAQGNVTGTDNISIGLNTNYSVTNLNNTITLGSNSNCNASNQITLGNSSVTSLRCNVQSISSLSDERDKTDINKIIEGLEFVNKLKPVTFTWNQRDGNRMGIKAAGFIAQDLLELQNKSAIGENLDLVTNTDVLKLEARYNNLLPVLVKAIQELSIEIELLKNL